MREEMRRDARIFLIGEEVGYYQGAFKVSTGGIMLAALAVTFTSMAESSTVLNPAQQQQVAQALEEDAEVMTNTHLVEVLAGQPAEVQAEIIRINTEARPISLQISLLVPILAALAGLLNSFRMMKLKDPPRSSAAETVLG